MDKAEEKKFNKWWGGAKRSLYCSHDLGNEDIIARVAYSEGIKDKEQYAQQVSREVAIEYASYIRERPASYTSFDEWKSKRKDK